MKLTLDYFQKKIDYHMERYEREKFYWRSGEAMQARIHLNLADYYTVKLLRYEKRWNQYKRHIVEATKINASPAKRKGKTGEK